MVAPGTTLREGIDNIVHARTGGLIIVGEVEDLSFLFSGGIKLEIDYSPALLYQVAKMDGAIVLNANATKIAMVNVQLMPDPTILSVETGTRHRTAERVSKQTDALVIAISQRREVVSLYVDGGKYILEDIPVVLAKANQALATLDKYRTRLDQVATRLTALEFEGGATLHDVLTVHAALRARHADGGRDRALHRRARHGGAPHRDAARGDDGRHRRRQGRPRARLPRREQRRGSSPARWTRSAACRITTCSTSAASPSCSATTASSTRWTIPSRREAFASSGASRACPSSSSRRSSPTSAGSTSCSPRPTPSSRPSTAWARSGRRTSARAFAACRRSTSWTATYRLDPSSRRRRD